jgi:hypothetical protein
MEKTNQLYSKDMRTLLIAARVIASVLALFFIVAFVPKLIQEIIDVTQGKDAFNGWEGIVMELTFLVFIIGYIISWWRVCQGGIIILLASIVQMGPFLIIDGNLGSLIFGVPLLVSGVLFIILCKMTR